MSDPLTPGSAIYTGFVWHQRYQPVEHKFRYRVFMVYLDLAEQDRVLAGSPLWGVKWYHPARFKRADYFAINGDYAQPLDVAVRLEVKKQIDVEVAGPVRLLTNFRYFGYNTNPISCYYCFNADATALVAVLIEVTNTPWGEKHHYVLDLRSYRDNDGIEFLKQMHVSPFMPMNRIYRWCGSIPAQTLRYSLASVLTCNESSGCDGSLPDEPLHHESLQSATGSDAAEKNSNNKVQFDSGVVFKRVPISGRALNRTILFYPFMTLKIILAIYWQALRLWVKKVPFVSHPSKSSTSLKTQN